MKGEELLNHDFYIVDDDITVVKIITGIIKKHALGEIAGHTVNAAAAPAEIAEIRPSIVVVDLLMPSIDGIALVKTLKQQNNGLSIIMLSQVSDKSVISKAYSAGIDFYIQKPINVVEVVSVINRVKEKARLEEIVRNMRSAIGMAEDGAAREVRAPQKNFRERVKGILTKLGISSDNGSREIVDVCVGYFKKRQINGSIDLKLGDLYTEISAVYLSEYGMDVSTATIEQRIRRTVGKALSNIASMGIEDYGNEVFETYANMFFDFSEVRNRMNYLRGNSYVPGKVNIKKFIEGVTQAALEEHSHV